MRFVVAALVVLVGLGAVRAGEEEAPLSAEAQEVFAWFDTLGFPDPSELRFVRAVGWTWPLHGLRGFGHRYTEHGFLLEEEGDRARVLGIGLRTRWIRERPPRSEKDEGSGWEARDLAAWVREGLDLLDGPAAGEVSPFGCRRWVTPQRYRLVVLAWWCARRGHPDLARRLFDRARQTGRHPPDEPFLSGLQAEIAREILYLAEDAFEDHRLTWRDLWRQHTRWLDHFAEHDADGQVAKRTEALEALAEEEERRAESPPKAWDAMTAEERAAELVHRLGGVDGMHLWRRRPGEQSAAAGLVEIGYDAVPALLDALDEGRPARTRNGAVFGKAQYRDRPWIFETRDLALGVLQQISGETFIERENRAFTEPDDGAWPEVRTRVEAWWRVVQSKGVLAHLREVTAAGGEGAARAAAYLVEQHPDAAFAAIVEGTRRATSAHLRATLVSYLHPFETEEVDAFFELQLRTAPTLHERVNAARLLVTHGHPPPLEALIDAWAELLPDDAVADMWNPSGRGGPVNLFHLLAGAGGVAGIEALGRGLAARPTQVREWVVYGISNTKEETLAPDVRAAQEALLVAALDPSGERGDLPPYWGDAPGEAPEVADAAAGVLARLFPDRYAFDREATPPERKRQRRAIANGWRVAHALVPRRPPGASPVTPLPETRLAPLREAVFAARDDEAVQEALQALAPHGVGALPVLRRWREGLPPDHPMREALALLCVGLASTVVEVAWDERSLPPGDELAASARYFEGRPLEAVALPPWIALARRQLPPKAGGLLVDVQRDGHGLGVVMRLELLRGTAPGSGEWEVRRGLAVAGESVVEFTPHVATPSDLERDAWWRSYVDALDQALRATDHPALAARVLVIKRSGGGR